MDSKPPYMTTEQRAEALRKGIAARQRRADFKGEIARGDIGAVDAFEKAKADPVLARMRVMEFIRAFPGYGKKKAEMITDQIGIPQQRRISGLHKRQAGKLLRQLH